MTSRPRSALSAYLRPALLCLVCLTLAGCTPMLVQVLKQDPRDPDRYLHAQPAELAGAATVYRGGRALPVSLPYQLQPGDVVQTGSDAVARIRYPEGHQIILDVNTRARLGSFFIEFGRILARARGFFEAESENVVAGVEGTEFVFQVPGDRSALVTVLDGAVVCRSKTQSWAPVRLRRGERFHLFPNTTLPDKRSVTSGELEDIRRWIRRVDDEVPDTPGPPRQGYCCADGRLFEAGRDQCRGRFFAERGAAEELCGPAAETGYCCSDGEVRRTTRERCRGGFLFEQAAAERACQIDRRGFCCVEGQVFETSRERCRGRFFADRGAAKEACRPPPETGYCCSDGEVLRTSRERCRGRFSFELAEAERVCKRDRLGFCCADGRVFETSREQCGGRFFPDRGSAEKYCRPPAEPGYCCSDGEVSKSTRDLCRGTFYRDPAEAKTACRRPIDPRLRVPPPRMRPYEIVPPRELAAPDIR